MIQRGSIIPGPGGTQIYSYVVEYRYGTSIGFDELPYFFFGTDGEGRDLFALTWAGIRTSLFIGFVVSMINITIGVVYGAIEGYYGGTVDLLMERFAEIVGRIPYLVVLTIFYAVLGPGFLTLVLILIISGWIGIASVTRTQFYRYKGREYVLASRTLGAKDARLIFRHILPNGIGTIITASVLIIPGVIFTESTLAFLGFGLGEGQDIDLGLFTLTGRSLGVILNKGQESLNTYPHLVVFPAIIVSILMITFNMFGNALRDAFNPSLRGAE
jgi:ABC-type dipeptide/oligopeptide/nickel transport system permease subunit